MRHRVQHGTPDVMTKPPSFIKPTAPPQVGISADLQAWQKLTEEAPQRALTAASTWRNGLAGFVTLLLSVLVLKGTDVGGLADPYRWIAIVGLVLGAALAIVGLWRALSAEAPLESTGDFATVLREHTSVAEYQQAVAAHGWRRLAQARFFVGLSLASILVGIIGWWSAPPTPTERMLSITWQAAHGPRTDCGSLVASLPRTVALRVNSGSDAVIVSASEILEVELVASCTSEGDSTG